MEDSYQQSGNSEACIEWLDRCNANCCRRMSFHFLPDEYINEAKETGWLTLCLDLGPDEERYLFLHGAYYDEEGLLKIPAGEHEVEGSSLHVFKDCLALSPERVCSIHDDKPAPCREFNAETAGDARYVVVEGCRYAELQPAPAEPDETQEF